MLSSLVQTRSGVYSGGSGKFTPVYKGTRVEVDNNDVTQSIEIRILTEEETAYGEALDHITELLQQGFPKEYYLKLKSKQKNYLPLKKMAKSGLHQFLLVHSHIRLYILS